MQLIDSMCPLCVEPDIALNTALMRHGPERTAQSRRMEAAAASPDGVLYTHWQHLKEMIGLPVTLQEPAFDADPILKTRWAQQQLFRLTFGLDDVTPITTLESIAMVKTKHGTLSSLLGAIRLEAELLGHVEAAKVKGKRKAEREAAKEEMAEDTLLNHDEQLKLYTATLRLNGYDVSKGANAEAIDITEEKQ